MQARIHPYFPFFHVDVTADVDLFCPGSGHTLSMSSSKLCLRASGDPKLIMF